MQKITRSPRAVRPKLQALKVHLDRIANSTPPRYNSATMTTAVIFDMDGVLVDSEPIIRAAAIRALAEFGIAARDEDFAPFVGAGEDRFVGGVAELHGAKFVPEMKRRTYDWYLKLLPTMGKAFPGGKELIETLNKRGISLRRGLQRRPREGRGQPDATAEYSAGLFRGDRDGRGRQTAQAASGHFSRSRTAARRSRRPFVA